ncbi:MAG: CPBP family intramembrane metalloprotease [Cyclobacteriaceae bacterium]
MDNTGSPLHEGDNQPLQTGIFGFLIALFGFIFLGPLIGSVVAFPFLENGLADLMELSENPTAKESFKVPLYILQGVTTLVGLIAIPWLFLTIRKDHPSESLFANKPQLIAYLMTAVAVITFMGFNSFFIEWNANVEFPQALEAFEKWAREYEDTLARATEFLTTFDTTGQFILALIDIAILPAIGEEIVFRGILQRKLTESGMNHHLAIWIAAILFSGIHFQFFGFIPRMLLGALFGYLYFWSNDIRIPMLAHFINNGFLVVALYINQLGISDYDLEGEEPPSLVAAIIFTIITAVLLILLYRHFKTKSLYEPVEDRF